MLNRDSRAEPSPVSAAAISEDSVGSKRTIPKAPGTPWWLWICVVAIVIFCLLPFYWLVNISLKTGPDLSSANLFPPHPSLNNYKSIFQNSNFTRALGNSAIVALTTVLPTPPFPATMSSLDAAKNRAGSTTDDASESRSGRRNDRRRPVRPRAHRRRGSPWGRG